MTRPTVVRTVLTTTLTVVAVVCALVLVYRLREPLSWIILATFLAVALSGPVNRLSRWMSRGKAIAVSYVLLILVPVVLLLIVVPPFVSSGSDLVEQLPEYAAELDEAVEENERLRELDEEFAITDKLREEAAELPARLGDAAAWLGDLGVGIVNSAFAAATILLLSVFIVANGRRWTDAALALGPPERATRISPVLDRMADAVGGYIGGALVQAAIAGAVAYVVMLILGIPYAAPLAVIVMLFDLIPMVGATLAAVFVGVITLFADFPLDTIIWAIFAIVYQQLENNLIQPRIQSRAVGVHPFLVIVSVLLAGTLLGVIGAILAVPIAASLQIAVREWWAMRTRAAVP